MPLASIQRRLPETFDPGAVYVVWTRLDAPPLPFAEIVAATSAEEQATAGRFRQEADARRHLIGRGLLRHAMAAYTGVEPAALRFRYTAAGKPLLDRGPSFNLSHSGDVIALALSLTGRIGVDVEAIRPIDDVDALAASAFVTDERAALAAMPTAARLRAFYRIWTRKEAMLKALGLGLDAIGDISVSAGDDADNALVRLDRRDEAAHAWTVHSLTTCTSVTSAIAQDHPIDEIVTIDVSGRPLPGLFPNR